VISLPAHRGWLSVSTFMQDQCHVGLDIDRATAGGSWNEQSVRTEGRNPLLHAMPLAIGWRKGTVRLTIKARPRSYTAAMPTARDPLYQRHRFPPEVISHAVWLYFRFP
jgi:hypothetical protein